MARITRVNHTNYLARSEEEALILTLSGRFQYQALSKSDYPVVGDMVRFHASNPGEGIIERIEPRHNTLKRLATTVEFQTQILAANLDLVLICLSLNEDYHPKKLRNFVRLADQDAIPYRIVLTKSDLTEDATPYIDQTRRITDAPIDLVSVKNAESMTRLRDIIAENVVVLLGSSGVGKSSLINAMLDDDRIAVQGIRESDAQGRHTTTHREWIDLPGGGAIIDTPGIRIIQFVDAEQLADEYADIHAWAEDCHFRDCRHGDEPGCAVQEAIDSGHLTFERFDEYQSMLRTQAFLAKREAQRKRIDEKRRRTRT
jgi:ribosome biogenesis GTPase